MGPKTQIFFRILDSNGQLRNNAPDDGSSSKSGEAPIKAAPATFMSASLGPDPHTGMVAVLRGGEQDVDQRAIQKSTTTKPVFNSIPNGTKPIDDGNMVRINNNITKISLADMSTQLNDHKNPLPEHWLNQRFRDEALTQFVLHATNNSDTEDYEFDYRTCLANANKLVLLGAVPNDDAQKAIDNLIERLLLQDRFSEATVYEHIWAAAKCPLKEKMVDTLLLAINKQLSKYDMYSDGYPEKLCREEVCRLKTILRMPEATLTPNQQRLLDMSYMKAKISDSAELTKSLQLLGGRSSEEAFLTLGKKIDELQTSLKTVQQGIKELHSRFDKHENQNRSRSICTIL